ncbi:MAG: hypothetical protein L3K10_04800 [Thermoplasmata archaeon]|nr:hypothetical protein [Thermoplasmata archaeon]
MGEPDAGPPLVALPERVDRRNRLGPFPSARDALKFFSYAAVGALLAPFASPFAWIPVLAGGFAVSVWRPDGEALDERAARLARWKLHRWWGGSVTRLASSPPVRGRVAHLRSGPLVTVIRVGGTPLAYRPPEELATLYDRYREVLRATSGPLLIRATTVPLPEGPARIERVECSDSERAARDGYHELVSVLCRRRRARRVEISLHTGATGDEGEPRLEERTRDLADQLTALGLRPTILSGRALAAATRQFGWRVGGRAS